MKTPDEIKKGLVHCSTKKPCTSCPMWEECKEASSLQPLWDNALAYIQQLEAENDNLRLSFATQSREVAEHNLELLKTVQHAIERVPKWISVGEKRPPLGEVLICTVGNWVGVARHHGDSMFETGSGLRLTVDGVLRVSHWMPMPEAPKED